MAEYSVQPAIEPAFVLGCGLRWLIIGVTAISQGVVIDLVVSLS